MQEQQTLSKLLASLCFAVSILGLSSCTDEEDGSTTTVPGKELSLKKVIVSVKATDQPEKLLAVKSDMENFLSEKLKRVVEIIIPTPALNPFPVPCLRERSTSACSTRQMRPAILNRESPPSSWAEPKKVA